VIYKIACRICVQSSGDFDVDHRHVMNLHSSLLDAKLSKLSGNSHPAKITDGDLNAIASKYEAFLRECNAVDMSDVYAAVTSACLDLTEFAEIVGRTSFVIVNPQFHCQIEVSITICPRSVLDTLSLSICPRFVLIYIRHTVQFLWL